MTEEEKDPRTPAQKKRNAALMRRVHAARKRIARFRKPETKTIAVLEGALDLVKDKRFWATDEWFNLAGDLDRKDDGPADYNSLCRVATVAGVTPEERVISVCAEGAIYLAANGLIDGREVIQTLNDTATVKDVGGSIMGVNDSEGQKATVKVFRAAIKELKAEAKR